jgi:hypothetical protein
MKLASYLADGRAAFGVVTDNGVITMNERLGGRAASLKDALALDLVPQIAEAAAAQAAAKITGSPTSRSCPSYQIRS